MIFNSCSICMQGSVWHACASKYNISIEMLSINSLMLVTRFESSETCRQFESFRKVMEDGVMTWKW